VRDRLGGTVFLGVLFAVTFTSALAVLIAYPDRHTLAFALFGLSALWLVLGLLILFLPRKREGLRKQAAQLAQELFVFMGEYRRGDPSQRSWFAGREASEQERQLRWDMHSEESTRHFYGFIASYTERFGARAWALYADLEHHGLIADDRVRFTFQHPTNTFGVQEIAQTLAAIGAGVKAKARRGRSRTG
jgi:hypothetical protein